MPSSTLHMEEENTANWERWCTSQHMPRSRQNIPLSPPKHWSFHVDGAWDNRTVNRKFDLPAQLRKERAYSTIHFGDNNQSAYQGHHT